MLKRAFCAVAALCLAIIAFPVLAMAATDTAATAVHLPIGDWLADLATVVVSIAGAVLAWLISKLPATIQPILRTKQAEQLLQMAIAYGVNAVAGAEKGKVLDVSVGNAVVAAAAQYAVDHGPSSLVHWLGGLDGIGEKIIARLDLDPAAAVSTTSNVAKLTTGSRMAAVAASAAKAA